MSIEFRSIRSNRVLLIDEQPVTLPYHINPQSDAEEHTIAVRDTKTGRLIGQPPIAPLAVFRQGFGALLKNKDYYGPTYAEDRGTFRGVDFHAY